MQVLARAGVAVYYRPRRRRATRCVLRRHPRAHPGAGPAGVVCVIDSGFGHLSELCVADAAGLQFVGAAARRHRLGGLVCHRRARRARRAGPARPLLHSGTSGCPSTNAAVWTACCASKTSPTTTRRHPPAAHRLHIGLPKQAASVADAAERALATRRRRARPNPRRPRRALLQTTKQVDDQVAQIIGQRIADLITVTTGVDGPGQDPPSPGTVTPTPSHAPLGYTSIETGDSIVVRASEGRATMQVSGVGVQTGIESAVDDD